MTRDEKRRALRRIERLARGAALLRLRGDVDGAMRLERRLNSLHSDAEKERFAGAALHAEERGHARAHRLYRKVRGRVISRLRKS